MSPINGMRVGLMADELGADRLIAGDLLGMWSALRRAGCDVWVFTRSGESRAPLETFHCADLGLILDKPDDLLIYHCRFPSRSSLREIRRLNCRVVVKYHSDISPDCWIYHAGALSGAQRRARENLVALSEMKIEAWISDCQVVAHQLVDYGVIAESSFVAPPFQDVVKLLALSDDAPTRFHLLDAAFNILAVGKLEPSADYEQMFNHLARFLGDGRVDARLHILGAPVPELPDYVDELKALLTAHRISDRVVFHGEVGSSRYATFLRCSDVIWTTALDESFCSPMVDAMAFGLPVLATENRTVQEICGESAIFVDSDLAAARALTKLADGSALRVRHGERARRRYQAEFSGTICETTFTDVLDRINLRFAQRSSPTEIETAGDWFDIPDVQRLISMALATPLSLPRDGLHGRDRRLDLVDWILRQGWIASDEIKNYLRGTDFTRYVQTLELPTGGLQLTPAMRLVWTFHRFANATFPLDNTESVMDFIRWFHREGASRYAYAEQ